MVEASKELSSMSKKTATVNLFGAVKLSATSVIVMSLMMYAINDEAFELAEGYGVL